MKAGTALRRQARRRSRLLGASAPAVAQVDRRVPHGRDRHPEPTTRRATTAAPGTFSTAADGPPRMARRQCGTRVGENGHRRGTRLFAHTLGGAHALRRRRTQRDGQQRRGTRATRGQRRRGRVRRRDSHGRAGRLRADRPSAGEPADAAGGFAGLPVAARNAEAAGRSHAAQLPAPLFHRYRQARALAAALERSRRPSRPAGLRGLQQPVRAALFCGERLGIACLPEFSVRNALAAGTLEVVLSAFTEPRHTSFRIFWPSSRHPLPKARALVDFLVWRLAIDAGGQ